MDKEAVVNWLNYRLKLSQEQKQNMIQDADIHFIREYIHHYKEKLVPLEQIVQSIQANPMTTMNHIEFMINKLVEDFNIDTKTKESGFSIMGGFMNVPPDAKLITKYF